MPRAWHTQDPTVDYMALREPKCRSWTVASGATEPGQERLGFGVERGKQWSPDSAVLAQLTRPPKKQQGMFQGTEGRATAWLHAHDPTDCSQSPVRWIRSGHPIPDEESSVTSRWCGSAPPKAVLSFLGVRSPWAHASLHKCAPGDLVSMEWQLWWWKEEDTLGFWLCLRFCLSFSLPV